VWGSTRKVGRLRAANSPNLGVTEPSAIPLLEPGASRPDRGVKTGLRVIEIDPK
jgi:hypothetical protein